MRWLQHFLFGGTLPVLTDESRQQAEDRMKHRLSGQEQQLQSSHKVLYDAVGQLSPGLSEEAFSTLIQDAQSLELNQVTLNFRNSAVEAEFQQHVAVRRRPILLLVFCFDVICYLFRMCVKFTNTIVTFPAILTGILPQLCNMAFLYFFLGLLNRRSRRLGDNAARQEELMLTGIMTLAVCNLLATINESNPQDYVYAAMFMISTTCFLKIQWLLGTVFMTLPLLVTHFCHKNSGILPSEAMVHLVVSWAVGGFMAYLSDTYRRQMFVNHRLAKIAAEKELQEAQARIDVQQQLAAAQTQAAQRAIIVAREKAANEAKSEFMSLMCHEVRTPLNGCLASAEMLLEMPLQEEQRELAKTIRVSGSILLSTVSNFLDFFKMEAGKQLDVVRTEMTTKDLVGDIHCIIEATIGRSSEVMLEKPNTDGVPDYVLGDPDRLRGILLNLYTNAAKFTKRGSIALRVRVASKDYRPIPEQVIKQQQRGPHARHTSSHQQGSVAHKSNHARQLSEEQVSWGSISVSPNTRSALANHEQAPSTNTAAGSSQVPTEASPAAAATVDESLLTQPAVSHVADSAYRSLQRGFDAKDASDAINEADNIETPVVNEHIAGQHMLQHTLQLINKASHRLQADAGLESKGTVKSQRGSHLRTADQLEPVREDTAEFEQPGYIESESLMSQPSRVDSTDAASSAQRSGSLQKQAGGQHEAGNSVKLGSSSGRVSSNSVLDQQDDSSSCSGGSPPSDSQIPAQSTEEQQQPSVTQRGSTDTAVDTLLPRPTGPQARQGGTPRTMFGERSHSNSDIAESDCSYRNSSSSFSDYLPPLRKSFSSPALHEPSEGAIPGQQSAKSSAQRCSLGGSMASSFSGRSSGKVAVGKAEATAVQDLGDGWFNTVAHRNSPACVESTHSGQAHQPQDVRAVVEEPSKKMASAFQTPPLPADPAVAPGEHDQWLVFEVTDTGCGISQHGLGSLFTEYVQGTEDDMKRPRTRGGTGLGLSICSKQVSVLGGLLGAMSKVGQGSTFWFTIPLLKPSSSSTRQSLSMRRTASWGSRDAFTDGHISHHADPPAIPPGRRTLAATTKPHRHHKRSYTPARSSNYQTMQQQQGPAALHSTPSMSDTEQIAGNLMQRHFPGEEAARRMSAPAAPPGRAGPSPDKPRQPTAMRTAASDDSSLSSQQWGKTTARARAAVARAVLSPQHSVSSGDSLRRSSSSNSGQRSSIATSQDSPEHDSGDYMPLPGQSHRHLDSEMRQGEDSSYNALQRNLLAQYKDSSEGYRPQVKAAEGSSVTFGRGQPLQALPEASSSAFQARDGDMTHLRDGNIGFQPRPDASSSDGASRQLNIRPSMEARRRRLGLSALQGRSVLLAEDNLINQRVAKMMLCSLGMCCEVASNGQEAVAAVKRRMGQEDVRQFDVLLMDMAMPVMGGVDATKEIRQAGAAVPIVAMTANSSDKDRDECLEAGMDGFLSKPVLKDRLAEAILNAVSGRRQFQDRQTISLKAYDRL